MKKYLLTLSLSLTFALAYQNGKTQERGSSQEFEQVVVLDSEIYELTTEQIEDIKFIYEEEKLARDVYLNLFDRYSLNIFQNIAESEQEHIDAVKSLVDKYSIDVSNTSNERGVFTNSELITLYSDLMQKGELSQTDAIEVGVLIEETDIEDLDVFIERGAPDAVLIYENLKSGSESHLRAFETQLSTESQSFANQSRIVKKGWSIIAYPNQHYQSSLPQNLSGSKVFRYRDNSWVISEFTIKDGNLTEVSTSNDEVVTPLPFEGFWIYSNEDFTLSY